METTLDDLDLLIKGLCSYEVDVSNNEMRLMQIATFMDANRENAFVSGGKTIDEAIDDIHREAPRVAQEVHDRITLLKAALVKERRRLLAEKDRGLLEEATAVLLQKMEPPAPGKWHTGFDHAEPEAD